MSNRISILMLLSTPRTHMELVAQLVRAPGCGPGGRGFEPHWAPSFYLLFSFIALFEDLSHGLLRPSGSPEGMPLAEPFELRLFQDKVLFRFAW